MKTTKTFRLLAVLLALVLAFGAMPALAVEIDSSDYAAWTQSAVDDLYGRLMAAENYEDYIAIVETLSETARTAFFNALTEEQQAALEEHKEAITLPIVSFTKVGPLLSVHASSARMMRAAARNGGSDNSGIVLNKTAEKTDDGYKITLEAYATGSSTTTVSTEPVDIVLVLDVSGSMNDKMGKTKKIDALKAAVNNFIDSVKTTSPDSRIAIIKFAGKKTDKIGNSTYTEITLEYNYSQIVKSLTKVGDNADSLKAAVNSLKPAGATAADYGMQHAQTIISGAANDGRKKVVIMFTDGEPNHLSGFNNDVANDAISASKSIKAAGATVYTIGIFSGADGTPVNNINNVSNKTNKYMHLVSSNYKNATSMTNTGDATYPEGGKSYFLSAKTSGDLSSIFTQISQEAGGSTLQLDATSVIKDVVTPYFNMPENASKVKVYTEDSKRNTSTWVNKTELANANIELDSTNNTVSVSGFSFKDNWCGTHTDENNEETFHDGKKLVIEFTVTAKDNFLGGNDVVTNGTNSGIYDKDGKLVKAFVVPTVNVPIKDVTVTAQDKNVYLLGEVTAEQLKTGATVKVGDVELKLGESNYGLEPWQTEYVDITVAVKDKDSNVISDSDKLENLTNDTTYTVEVTVSPKTDGTGAEGTQAVAESGVNAPAANINVFKPELTFKDSRVEYKKSVLTLNSQNYADIKAYFEANNKVSKPIWKHGNTENTGVTMIGTEPTLDLTYTPESGKIVNNIVESTTDILVKVEVKIGENDVTGNTTFEHQPCNPVCGWMTPTTHGDPAFLLHVINVVGDLTITKKGLNEKTYAGTVDQESAIFTVTSKTDSTKTWTVAINGNNSVTLTGLEVGNYTVTELTDWTWRYRSSTLTSDNKNDDGTFKVNGGATTTVTCTNSNHNDKWLGGDNYKNNVFGSGN